MKYIFILFILSGCAGFEAQEPKKTFDKYGQYINVKVIVLPDGEFKRKAVVWGFKSDIKGVAFPFARVKGDNYCLIYVPESAKYDDWLLGHELKHCLLGKWH